MPDQQHVSNRADLVSDAAAPGSEQALSEVNEAHGASFVASRQGQHVVPIPRGLVRLPLQQQLADAIQRPITLVIAGAGMGKTQALARLCRAAPRLQPVWYALHADDVEPTTLIVRLFRALGTAIRPLQHGLEREIAALEGGQGEWPVLLARGLETLRESPQPILLCFDEIHAWDARLAAVWSQLMGRLHPRLRLVLCAEQMPNDPLWAECSRLHNLGHLSLVTEEAFRFSVDEVQLLLGHHGFQPSSVDALQVHALADGWPYLLDWTLRTAGNLSIAEIIRRLMTGHRHADLDALVHDPLVTQLHANVQQCLIWSALPDYMHAAALTTVCGATDALEQLDRWVGLLPALCRLGDDLYTYHYLFRTYLRRLFLALPREQQHQAARASTAAALMAGDWTAAAVQWGMLSAWDELCRVLAPRAASRVLDLHLDGALGAAIALLPDLQACRDAGYLLCYRAMEHRLVYGDYAGAVNLAQRAVARFDELGDREGRARALAEGAIARYHLGQHALALAELAACPAAHQPTVRAALCFATFLNHIGTDALAESVAAANRGLQAIAAESRLTRAMIWRIVLQRNLAMTYHFQGDLDTARRLMEEAVYLAAQYHTGRYAYDWTLYELGLLGRRAGWLDRALSLLRTAREGIEQTTARAALWRWIVVAEGHTLRDLGQLEAAEERYRLGGWGEGDEGPLMLWLLQGRHVEARFAAEARLIAARAAASPVEVTNLTVLSALLDLEAGATATIRDTLQSAADHYATLGFRHNLHSVQLHLAATLYALDDRPGGDCLLAEALHFGARSGYLNFAWWHPERMRTLLRHALTEGMASEYTGRLLRERGLADRVDDAALVAPVPETTLAVAAEAGPVAMTLRCLGTFEAMVDAQLVPRERWQGHPAGAIRMQRLLLYLARHRAPQPIAMIGRYVWADSWERIDLPGNVHLTLTGLRRVFEPEREPGAPSHFVVTTSEGYRLRPDLEVTVDVDQMQTYLRSGRVADALGDGPAARAAFTEVEQLYTGDFALAKPDPGEAEAYRRAAMEAVRWLAHDDLRQGAFDACIERARRVAREDPWDEQAPALLIAAYIAAGNRRGARRQYQRYLELHDRPSCEIVRLAKEHAL